MAERQTGAAMARNQERQAQLQRSQWRSPFGLLQRFADEMDRVFEGAFSGRTSSSWSGLSEASGAWAPEIDVFQRGNELVIHADVPGLNKEDLKVDVQEDAVTIQGERRREHEEEREGIYRSERSYGTFYRTIPLPPGAITDQAKAQFKNGVLEIVMPAPPEQVSRGRRLEISEATGSTK
jgi:HSP20 family protein